MRVAWIGCPTPRLALSSPSQREGLSEYVSAGGYRAGGSQGPALIESVADAGLRGRGGAGFPTGVKLRAVAAGAGRRYVIANGEENEPTCVKDRWLLRFRPHLMLDGLLRACEAIDAERAYVVASDPAGAASVRRALEELGAPPVPIELVELAPAYVAGEETALVRAVAGDVAKPTAKPPRPYEHGVGGYPTLVLNVETLANLPEIALDGPDAFRALGTPGSPGTAFITLSGACNAPGLYEAALGTPLGEMIESAGGFSDGETTGFLMGGFFGGVLGCGAVATALDYDRLREGGSGLGCGAIVVLGASDCAVAAAADVMAFFARENAKQCGACINGTAAMRDALLELATGVAGPDTTERLARWSTTLRRRGACALLDGAAQLAGTLLREFADDVDRHLAGPCARCAALLGAADAHQSRFAVSLDQRWEASSP